MGTCERLITTPIPLSYTRHTSRVMVVWLSALPLGLWSTCGLATVPLCLTIAYLLLGIDEIGVQVGWASTDWAACGTHPAAQSRPWCD